MSIEDSILTEQEKWEEFVLKNMLLIVEEKLSKDQKSQIKRGDYERVLLHLIRRTISISKMRFWSAEEVFDLFVGQLRMYNE